MRKWHAEAFIEEMTDHTELIDAIFSIIHKELHGAAGTVMKKVRSRFRKYPAVQHWKSNFTGVSVVTNRLTPEHVNSKTGKFWYDILTSAGLHDTAYLDTPELGYTFFLSARNNNCPLCIFYQARRSYMEGFRPNLPGPFHTALPSGNIRTW